VRSYFTLALVCVSVACASDDATNPPVGRRGIQILSGANVTDTIGTILSQALVIEVFDSTGKLAPQGTSVRFEAVTNAARTGFETFVLSIGLSAFSTTALGTTDAAGRTSILVRLGFLAGPARVAIYVPTLGLRDTARYTVTPGAPANISLAPQDTAVTVGRGLSLRVSVTDSHGNARNDQISWQSSEPGVAISPTGQVTTSAIGRYTITARVAPASAIAALSVVPQGRIAGVRADAVSRIILSDLDGLNVRDIGPIVFADEGGQPMWLPGTNRVLIAAANQVPYELRTVDDAGNTRRFLTTVPATLESHTEPGPTANGQWVFFSGIDNRCLGAAAYCLYRARSDGTGAELLSDTIQQTAAHLRPAPSPDGSKVAYVGRNTAGIAVIKVLDVATRSVASWSVSGLNPRWAPDGTQIAFLEYYGGRIMLVRPDGTGVRALTDPSVVFTDEPMSWSADGKFILARIQDRFAVVDVATGVTIPLPHTITLLAATFRW